MDKLLEALANDNLVALGKILDSGSVDLSQEVMMGTEYELDDYDEVSLLFFAISSGASLEAIEMLIDAGVDIAQLNHEGLSAIDVAIKYKRLDVLKFCHSKGMDLSQSKRKSGITPLILAASFSDMQIVSYLIENGADIDGADNYGMRAVDYAKRMGQKKMLEFLEAQSSND